MKNKDKKPMRVALHGMEVRAYKTMVMYLQGPCKGIAIVDELNAEIDIIDADFIKVDTVLNSRDSYAQNRPAIVLSLHQQALASADDSLIYVKKPVQLNSLIVALEQAQLQLAKQQQINEQPLKKQPLTDDNIAIAKTSSLSQPPSDEASVSKGTVEKENEPKVAKKIDFEEKKKTSKHRTAMQLNEGSFSAFIGHVEGVDFDDPEQVLKASFNEKKYFLGYVSTSVKLAKEKKRVLQLHSNWKPLLIFPHGNEVWLDADDKQLRAFAGLSIKKVFGKGVKLTTVSQKEVNFNDKMQNFYDTDTFLWKLAVWTSKGRYPDTIDIHKPVYLKFWPNFTRLVITPHALRIAALLIQEPRTLMDIANTLKIKPQYVFVFISAANVLGLIGQATRQVDEMIEPPAVKSSKSKGLLGRILGRLRGQQRNK